MKKSWMIAGTVFILSAFVSLALFAFSEDDVLGTWMVPKQDGKIKIYKCGKKYCGQIVWLKVPGDLDTKNPDPAKRKDKLLNKVIMWGFKFDGKEWSDGKIYDPDEGSTYSCVMWLENRNKLKVKGYVGISLIGRAEVWTRTN